LDKIPSSINAGVNYTWTVSDSDYPASDGWTLYYRLIPITGTAITFNSSASGDDHVITLDDATTANYTAGTYKSYSYFGNGTDKYQHENITVTVVANYITATSNDFRSYAKKCLDAIEAVILGRASHSDMEYTIAGRQLKNFSIVELMDARTRFKQEYENELAKELADNGLPTGRKILFRMVSGT